MVVARAEPARAEAAGAVVRVWRGRGWKGVARKNHIRHVRFFRRTFSSGVTLTHPFIHLTPF